MKIKSIKKCENDKIKYIVPIATSAIGLGLTAYLISNGTLQYDNLADFGKVKEVLQYVKLPGY